jgi:hypothetical protein
MSQDSSRTDYELDGWSSIPSENKVPSYTLHTQNIQSLMQPEFFILILPRHVSAALGLHQVLLLKLPHCIFYIICSFRYALLFICLMLRPTLFPFSTSPLLVL